MEGHLADQKMEDGAASNVSSFSYYLDRLLPVAVAAAVVAAAAGQQVLLMGST